MTAESTTYRMSRAVVLRVFGRSVFALGAVLLVGVVAGALIDLPAGVIGGAVALAVVALLALTLLVARPPRLLALSTEGYSVHHVPASAVSAARWRSVGGVQTRDSPQGPLVVLALDDGRTSIVPVTLLGARATEAQREIHDRLNAAHGYRRLD